MCSTPAWEKLLSEFAGFVAEEERRLTLVEDADAALMQVGRWQLVKEVEAWLQNIMDLARNDMEKIQDFSSLVGE
jgi:hypothetical protein